MYSKLISFTGRNCVWSRYGSWSECSQSCGGGEQVRVRRVKTQAAGGGRECRGGTRERRKCNQVSCPVRLTTTSTRTKEAARIQTTRRTTTRTNTTKRTTTRRPKTTTKIAEYNVGCVAACFLQMPLTAHHSTSKIQNS